MHWIWSGDGTPQSCTSAILEIDFAFGSKNPTDVSQLAALAVGVSRERLLSSEPVADFNDAIENVWEDWSFAYEGGESNDVAQRRAVICMQSILKKYKGKNIVIGTHGNIMVLLMNYFDSKYDFRFWKTIRMPDIFKLNFHNEDLVSAERIENTGHQINNL
ncbi:hypothetical protein BC30090_1643 [Bacillus cereus]|nr:hypothetical protein BC30090_1643 [Bacillus cereus]